MNSDQLRKILHQFVPLTFDDQVLASDQLDFIRKKKFAVILNSDTSKENGMHWLGLFKESEDVNIVEFFDSFGMPIEFYSPHLKRFLLIRRYDVLHNFKPLQSMNSEVCGQYCIYFLFQ